MKDHNGLPVVFTEHENNISCGESLIRYIVNPFGIHGLIGCAGRLSGERVLYDVDEGWTEYRLRKSCRSKQKDIMENRGAGATVACPDFDLPFSYSIQQAFDWLVTGRVPQNKAE